MQGRLSPILNNKIQEFPWESWQKEFEVSSELGFKLMEWTLDHYRLYENPLMTKAGQKEILRLSNKYNIKIPSLTGDCFMQAPFWKASQSSASKLKQDFLSVCHASKKNDIQLIVVPLVDNGRLDTRSQEDELVEHLLSICDDLRSMKLMIVFEIDFDPIEVARFISRLPSDVFGINYDIGNSAALGFNVSEEMSAYGNRVCNVHIKDRVLGGGTVPLLSGDANFPQMFAELNHLNYSGNFILQTARAKNNDHSRVLSQYFQLTKQWIADYA